MTLTQRCQSIGLLSKKSHKKHLFLKTWLNWPIRLMDQKGCLLSLAINKGGGEEKDKKITFLRINAAGMGLAAVVHRKMEFSVFFSHGG